MSCVVYSCPDFLIARKPHGLPTVPLKTQAGHDTLLGRAAEEFPQVLSVSGKNPWEGSALHRLDTATAGLVLFALTQDFYNHMTELQEHDGFEKTYIARCTANPLAVPPRGRITSYFRSYGPHGRMVRPVQDITKADTKRLYTTKLEVLDEKADTVLFLCRITRGFRHQIRAHLAFSGFPIRGDTLYNPECGPSCSEELALECTALSFSLMDGTPFSFSI